MRLLLLLVLSVGGLLRVAASQPLESTDRGYVWRCGDEYVRFDRGRWTAGIEGEAEFAWDMVLWHDQWIYETLAGGEVDAPPALTDERDQAYAFRLNLLDRDFAVDETVVLENTISFAQQPARYPGQIEPGRQPLAIHGVTPATARVPQYSKLELCVALDATYDNPFDPDDVQLDALFTTPSGRQCVVPGFFTVEHRCEVADGVEVLIPQQESGWRVRFTPQEIGRYQWQLRLRDRSGEITGGGGTVECTPGNCPGFIRTSKSDPHYLAFDNGDGFSPSATTCRSTIPPDNGEPTRCGSSRRPVRTSTAGG